MKSTKTILKELVKLFDSKDKWIKNKFTNATQTSYCVLGGIGKVCFNEPCLWQNTDEAEPVVTKVAKALDFKDDPNNDPWEQLVSWNNAGDTTYRKFINRLKKGLAKLEAK